MSTPAPSYRTKEIEPAPCHDRASLVLGTSVQMKFSLSYAAFVRFAIASRGGKKTWTQQPSLHILLILRLIDDNNFLLIFFSSLSSGTCPTAVAHRAAFGFCSRVRASRRTKKENTHRFASFVPLFVPRFIPPPPPLGHGTTPPQECCWC